MTAERRGRLDLEPGEGRPPRYMSRPIGRGKPRPMGRHSFLHCPTAARDGLQPEPGRLGRNRAWALSEAWGGHSIPPPIGVLGRSGLRGEPGVPLLAGVSLLALDLGLGLTGALAIGPAGKIVPGAASLVFV
jgi:hypothetical protein